MMNYKHRLKENIMNKGWMILMWTMICILFVILFGWITMFLWNSLVPSLFRGPFITFWQSLGLLLLSKILFGGFGGKRWGNHNPMQWKQRYYEKFSAMSPEERERFKSRMREKWCYKEPSTSKENSDTSNV
jgi:hypothetical protein